MLRWHLYIGVSLFALLATPILSTYFVFWASNALGCDLSAAHTNPCFLFGLDIGDRIYGYAVPLIGSLLTPVAFLIGFWEFILVWIGVHLVLRLLVRKGGVS